MVLSKSPQPSVLQRVDGIVFYNATHEEGWLEMLGIPFENRSHTWTVRRRKLTELVLPTLYTVYSSQKGRRFGLSYGSIEAAKTVAIELRRCDARALGQDCPDSAGCANRERKPRQP